MKSVAISSIYIQEWNDWSVFKSLNQIYSFLFQVDCQNYIRVLAKTRERQLLVCGTNAYNPKCRYYSHNETHSTVDREFSGKGFCPYDPRHNSTFIYAGKFLNASKYCGSVLKNDFVVVVGVGDELLSYFQRIWLFLKVLSKLVKNGNLLCELQKYILRKSQCIFQN